MELTEKHKIFVDNVSLRYSDGIESLNNVTMPVIANKINVMLGPSGGGKSSLLRLFNRLNDLADVDFVEGRVLLDGVDVLNPETNVIELRRKVGMVFSRAVVLPMSIKENLIYGLELAGIKDPKKLEETIETSLIQSALWDEVKDRLDDSAFALSGGQKQRLCLARVLANEPEVILLDEPTAALDNQTTNYVIKIVKYLKDIGSTLIIVTHDIKIMDIVDEVIDLNLIKQ